MAVVSVTLVTSTVSLIVNSVNSSKEGIKHTVIIGTKCQDYKRQRYSGPFGMELVFCHGIKRKRRRQPVHGSLMEKLEVKTL